MLSNNQKTLAWKELKPGVAVAHFPSVIKNQQIYVKKVQALHPVKNSVTLFLFHDLAAYHGRFAQLVEWFQLQNPEVSFIMMDFMGHGLSTGTRGHITSIHDLVNDVMYLMESVSKDEGERWITLGSGLGALVILDLLNRVESPVKQKIDSLILSNFFLNFDSALFKVQSELYERATGPTREMIDHLRLSEIFPAMQMLTLKRDQMLLLEDPLIAHKPTFGSLRVIMEKVRSVYQDAYFLDIKTLLLESQSSFVQENGAEVFAKGLKKELVRRIEYAFLKHDLYNDNEKEIVFKDMAEWLNS